MRDQLFHLDRQKRETLQMQIRELLIKAILNGQIPRGGPVPSCRELAKRLGVSRNTVVLSYDKLVDDGFLKAQERSGYYVASDLPTNPGEFAETTAAEASSEERWERRLQTVPSRRRNISKPSNWKRYPFPFIYGQLDLDLFPFSEWRECSRDAISEQAIRDWACDSIDGDDPLLVEQLQSTVLPRRGVWAKADEILVTLGTQHSLYIASQLFCSSGITVGVEDPGYVDARNIFESSGARLVALPVDSEGLIVDDRVNACDLIYITPSHQSPTTVTMPLARRQLLLEHARSSGFLIIEDDYESETNFLSKPTPALKSLDDSEQVIYVGSLSKTLAPGLRVGYMVAPRRIIAEARALRRLMVRHPPSNNQATTALFLARGYHELLVHRLSRVYKSRWEIMSAALERYLPDMARIPTFGGTSFWLSGPKSLDCLKVAEAAAKRGVLIEPGDVHFMSLPPPKNCFRIGFSAASEQCIEEGIARLAQVIRDTR